MAQYVEGPYIVEDQPDGTRKVVGYVNQQGGQQSNTLITKRADPSARAKAANEALASQLDPALAQQQLINAQRQQPNEQFNQRDKLRSDFDAQPVVKEYRAAVTALAQALETAPNAGGDNALIYAYAKIMDPASVVRESEMEMAGNTESTISRYATRLAKELGLEKSGQLSAEARDRLRREAINAVSQRVKLYDTQRRRFSDYAERAGFDPYEIVGPHDAEPFLPQFRAYGKKDVERAIGDGPKLPNMVRDLPEGTEIQFNYAKPDGGFDRAAWLQANFGISPDQEAQITSFMRANRGNPNFSYENLRDYYKAINAPPPERNDETIKAIREGTANVTGYDSSLAEQLYNMALEKRVAERDTALGAVDTVGRTAANAFFGAGDRVAAAFGPDDYATNLAAQRFETDAARQANPIAAFSGDVAGLLAGTYTTGALAQNAATRFAPALARQGAWGSSISRNLANDAFYGTTLAAINDQNPYAAGALALGGSAAGQIIGAPVGRALANTVQSSPRAMQGLNAVSQIFGGRAKPTLPQMSTAQRMMVDAVGDRGPQVLNNLQQAAQMGVPMSLADADTGLTALGGAVVRRSPDARNIAINAFEPRAQGQYDRLVGAVERDFGPVANIPQRSEDLIQQARTASRPLYEPLESLPPRTSPALDEMLNTNAGMTAMRNATQIADAQRAPAGSMTIGQDAAGNPVFTATPNFQTLNYVKQGFDRSYETLNRAGDPLAGSINSLRKDYLAEMDNLYPGYAEARAAYAGPAAEREAFQAGVGARNMTPDGLAFAIKDMPEPRLEQFRLGRISDIVDQAGKVKYTANPWNSVVGSPAEQQRLATLFPENAPSFIKQYQLERDIARSQNAILGGSPTAERQLMDQAFQGNIAGDMALDAMTTGAPIKSGLNILGRFGKDELGRIGAEKKAKEIAPVLFDTDAARAAEAFRKSKKAKKARGIFGRRGARAGASVVSAPIMTSGYE